MSKDNSGDQDQALSKVLDAQRKKDLTALPEGERNQIAGLQKQLEDVFLQYFRRPGHDLEVGTMVKGLFTGLDNSLAQGFSGEAVPSQIVSDVKAALTGARSVLDRNIERGVPVVTPDYAMNARRFLELTHKRVGKYDPKTGDAEIRGKSVPGQILSTITARNPNPR